MDRITLNQFSEGRHFFFLLLKRSQCAAVRALPVHTAAGQSPQILLHAAIADLKATGTSPAKRLRLITAAAPIFSLFPFSLDSEIQCDFSFAVRHQMVIRGEETCWRLMMRQVPSRRDSARALVASLIAFSGVLLTSLRWASTTHRRSR